MKLSNNYSRFFVALVFYSAIGFSSCAQVASPPKQEKKPTALKQLSDSALLDLVQEQTIKYFTEGAEPVSGMARERFHVDNNYPENDKHIITSGGSGFGVMCLLVAMERKFITREDGVNRLEKMVGFLER